MKAMEELNNEEPDLTGHQVKLIVPKISAGVGRWTTPRLIPQRLES